MVGIFQIFGFNFVFWVLMGALRFIFDTLQILRKKSQKRSFLTMVLASAWGVVVTTLLIVVFVYELQLFPYLNDASLSFATFPIWVVSIAIGAYVATRIYVHEPNAVGSAVGLGSIAVGTALFYTTQQTYVDLAEDYVGWNIWIIFTICAGLIGSNLAQHVNTWETKQEKKRVREATKARVAVHEVAVVIAAYNEELTIASTIQSLLKNTTKEHIYVGSDGSKDKTVEVVKALGCNVLDLQPNGGKAKALARTINENGLLDRYKAIYLVDADIKVGEGSMEWMAAQFDDPTVAAVVNRTNPLWPKHYIPQYKYFFTAYRMRLWLILRYTLRYGQTWKYMNVSPIIPGGGSMYRTSAIRQIKIDVPGLIIEDFNMTFSVHHQRLGRISFQPGGPYNIDQEPFSLRDYVKQIYRWYLGFFQTVRHHGVWMGWFFFSMLSFNLEMIVSSLFFLSAPLILIAAFVTGVEIRPGFSLQDPYSLVLTIMGTFLLFDYLVTVLVAIAKRRPLLLFYGFFFPLLRYVESSVFLYALLIGIFTRPKTQGRWMSPKRIAYTAKSSA